MSPDLREPNSHELATLTLVAAGTSNRDIAATTGQSGAAVKAQLALVRRKLGARNRAHAVAIALRSGLIEPPEPAVERQSKAATA
ncbi:response regulator transcription factor [Streptomyces sp. NPDC060194]|uniref:response regulator transcription factor n=1 Tax=Streptomyces sp. NPDC060194 TaxID=3347069 RepID=UPI00365A30A8